MLDVGTLTAASETAATRPESTTTAFWHIGVAVGSPAAVAIGVMIVIRIRPVLEVTIPSMYGLAGGTANFTIHVAYGATLGAVFVGPVSALDFDFDGPPRSPEVSVGYDVVLWVVLVVSVIPMWLGAVGPPVNPPLPNMNMTSLVGHVIYGVVLGVPYSAPDGVF